MNDPPWSSVAARVAPTRARDRSEVDGTRPSREPRCGRARFGHGGGPRRRLRDRHRQIHRVENRQASDPDSVDHVGGRRVSPTRSACAATGACVTSAGCCREYVVLDIDLVRSAPKRMNRSGIGDILSCHTGLWDWRFAVDRGEGVAVGRGCGIARSSVAGRTRRTSQTRSTPSHRDAVRWLASAYQRIGGACSALGHSRFEEGSEHFLAYAYEHRTNAHPLHGELIAMCVVAMSTLQANDPEMGARRRRAQRRQRQIPRISVSIVTISSAR